MKIIENYNTILTELLFKYTSADKRKADIIKDIEEFFQTLFFYNYSFEFDKYKIFTSQTYSYFILDNNNNIKTESSYKSLYLRLFKILFCDNLSKSRKEPKLFLTLFENLIKQYPISNLVSSEYLLSFIPLITNYTLDDLENVSNKKNNNFTWTEINSKSLKIFCEIILTCATPSMRYLKKDSPYLSLKLDDLSKYPKLPENIKEIYIKEFMVYFLLNNNTEELIEKVLCHLCWEDELVSKRILWMVNCLFKYEFFPFSLIENATFNAAKIFKINDSFTHKRIETLFELEDDENITLNKFLIENKYKNCDVIVNELFILAKVIENYENVFEYFKKNKKELEWVKEYYVEFFEDKLKLSFINKIHPDVFSVIETQIINRLEL